MGDDPSNDQLPVDIGHAIFALHDPHKGFERAFNRYYERDHMYAGSVLAPWTIAAQRWVAPAPLKRLRHPDPGPFGAARLGSYLSTFWIQAGRLTEQQAWVAEQMALLAEAGRTFEERDVQTATAYDYLGAWERDEDGVPPFLALDHRYDGLIWTVLERSDQTPQSEFARWLKGEFLAEILAGTSIAQALLFSPRPKEPWWPAAAPEVPGVGQRVFVASFVEGDVATAHAAAFSKIEEQLTKTGRGRTLLTAPFVPTEPGTDRYADELW